MSGIINFQNIFLDDGGGGKNLYDYSDRSRTGLSTTGEILMEDKSSSNSFVIISYQYKWYSFRFIKDCDKGSEQAINDLSFSPSYLLGSPPKTQRVLNTNLGNWVPLINEKFQYSCKKDHMSF